MTPSEVKELLARYGITPTKSKGQNFLLDERVAELEVDALGIGPQDEVLEVGPGLGILTGLVAQRAKGTTCVELDPQVAAFVRDRFSGKVRLIEGDALEIEFPPFDLFLSNLPYSISSPLLFKVLDIRFKRGVVMVQKEFADRMVAKAGSDDYSRLSVTTYYRARCEVLAHVPRSKFWPQPEVDSSVVAISPRPAPFQVRNERFYLNLVAMLFQHRRKKIGTILRMTGQAGKERIPSLPFVERRVEDLTPEEIGTLSDRILD